MTTLTHYNFTRATPSDVESVLRIVNQANARVEYRNPEALRTTQEKVAALVEEETLFVLKKEDDTGENQILATVTLTTVESLQNVKSMEIGMLAVDPKFQGKGIGHCLLEELLKRIFFIELCEHACLSVFSLDGEKLSQFYERIGFQRSTTPPSKVNQAYLHTLLHPSILENQNPSPVMAIRYELFRSSYK